MSQTQQEQGQQTTAVQDEQSLYDQSFLAQISQGQTPSTQTVDWAREYFDSIEAQVRSARRVVEVAALGQIKQQIAAQAATTVYHQVLMKLQTDPSFRKQLMAGTETGK